MPEWLAAVICCRALNIDRAIGSFELEADVQLIPLNVRLADKTAVRNYWTKFGKRPIADIYHTESAASQRYQNGPR